MHRLPLVTDLCATESATCIACCRGRGMTERALEKQLRRQTAIFSKILQQEVPARQEPRPPEEISDRERSGPSEFGFREGEAPAEPLLPGQLPARQEPRPPEEISDRERSGPSEFGFREGEAPAEPRFPAGFPDRLTLLRHELASRRGLDFFLAILFLLPGVGPLLRRHAHHRLCCAFLGYPEGDESRPGCLLHPSRWGGIDRRQESAFALVPGFGCGEPGYFCRSAYLFRALPQPRGDRFRSETRSHSSFAYSRAVEDAEDDWMRSPSGDHQ